MRPSSNLSRTAATPIVVVPWALIGESSWFRGANIPGKPKRYPPYAGSLVTFRKRLEAIAEEGYPGFDFQVPAAV